MFHTFRNTTGFLFFVSKYLQLLYTVSVFFNISKLYQVTINESHFIIYLLGLSMFNLRLSSGALKSIQIIKFLNQLRYSVTS